MPVAGFMAVLGFTLGAGLSDDQVVCCLIGMMGRGSVHGVVGGLAHCPLLLRSLRQSAQALNPLLAMRKPALESRPMRNRSRRFIKPAAISSCRFLNALYISRHLARETFSPLLL